MNTKDDIYILLGRATEACKDLAHLALNRGKEIERLQHDLDKAMANHNADLNAARPEAQAHNELANLVDRAQKIFLMAIPSAREPEAIHSDSNDPINAWMADAYKALRRST